MKTIAFPIALLVLAAGCQAPQQRPAITAWTLRDNPRLPTDEIGKFYTSDKFAKLQNLKYEGYVILEATAITETMIRVDRIAESFPDGARDEIAKELARKARTSAHTVGSHLPPPIEVYVIFYPTSDHTTGALVYGEELPTAGPISSMHSSLFLFVAGDPDGILGPNDVSTVKMPVSPQH